MLVGAQKKSLNIMNGNSKMRLTCTISTYILGILSKMNDNKTLGTKYFPHCSVHITITI